MAEITTIVDIASDYGFEVYEAFDKEGIIDCQLINFKGNEFDLMNLFDILQAKGIPVKSACRVYRKEPLLPMYKDEESLGDSWKSPFNRITFFS